MNRMRKHDCSCCKALHLSAIAFCVFSLILFLSVGGNAQDDSGFGGYDTYGGDYGADYGGYGGQDVIYVPVPSGTGGQQGQGTVVIPQGQEGQRGNVPALDQPLIPEEYVLSPGDTCSLQFWGRLNTTNKFRITADGTAFVPEIGIFKVAGKTLSEFRAEIDDRIAVTYINVEHYLQVTTPHTLKVKIYGLVDKPGWYHFAGPTRVSEAIEKAGGIAPQGTVKNVNIVRRGSDLPTKFDLFRVRSGVKHAPDPYLQPGDMIYVPVITKRVEVAGEFIHKGMFEISDGETLYEIVKEADGPALFADLDKAHIKRNGAEIPIKLKELYFDQNMAYDMELEIGDKIFVPKRLNTVYVVGAVMRPGPVDYDPSFTLIDYIGKARGPHREAALQAATIVRGPPDNVEKIRVDYRRLLRGDPLYENPQIEPGDIIVIPAENNMNFNDIYKAIYGSASVFDILRK